MSGASEPVVTPSVMLPRAEYDAHVRDLAALRAQLAAAEAREAGLRATCERALAIVRSDRGSAHELLVDLDDALTAALAAPGEPRAGGR